MAVYKMNEIMKTLDRLFKYNRYAGCRAINEARYMRDATGSNKKYSFRLLLQVPNNIIIQIIKCLKI